MESDRLLEQTTDFSLTSDSTPAAKSLRLMLCSQTPVFTCCWPVCRASVRRCSWVCWRPAPPASTPSAPPAATPAPAAAPPSRRRPWRSSTATPTATRSCLSPAASQPSASSFVWSAVRSVIAARAQFQDMWLGHRGNPRYNDGVNAQTSPCWCGQNKQPFFVLNNVSSHYLCTICC